MQNRVSTNIWFGHHLKILRQVRPEPKRQQERRNWLMKYTFCIEERSMSFLLSFPSQRTYGLTVTVPKLQMQKCWRNLPRSVFLQQCLGRAAPCKSALTSPATSSLLGKVVIQSSQGNPKGCNGVMVAPSHWGKKWQHRVFSSHLAYWLII